MLVFCTGDVTSLYGAGEKYKVLPNSVVFYLGLNVLFFSNIFSSVLFSVFINNIFVSIPIIYTTLRMQLIKMLVNNC